MSKKASTSLDQIDESLPFTPAFAPAPAAKSTPVVKAPEVSPSTMPPSGIASSPVQTIPQLSGLGVNEAPHGFDEFLDENGDSFDDLAYIGLHGHPPPEGWSSSNRNEGIVAPAETTMAETPIALKEGNQDRIQSPPTSTSTAPGSTDKGKKRAHGDEGASTKTAKRKTGNEVEPTARKRPVCSTEPRVAVSSARGAMQPTPEPAPGRRTAEKPDAVAKRLTTANSTTFTESTITAADIADQILQKTPRASKGKSTSPVATMPKSGKRTAAQAFISTTSASATRSAPIAKSATATKPVPTAKTSTFAKTPMVIEPTSTAKSAPTPKPTPIKKAVASKDKISKPVLNKKFAKSVGVKLSKLKKSNAGAEPMALSATASRLSLAQLAARKAAKRQPAKEAEE